MVTGDAGFQRVPALRLALVDGGEGEQREAGLAR
jgi:hypothetical protein